MIYFTNDMNAYSIHHQLSDLAKDPVWVRAYTVSLPLVFNHPDIEICIPAFRDLALKDIIHECPEKFNDIDDDHDDNGFGTMIHGLIQTLVEEIAEGRYFEEGKIYDNLILENHESKFTKIEETNTLRMTFKGGSKALALTYRKNLKD